MISDCRVDVDVVVGRRGCRRGIDISLDQVLPNYLRELTAGNRELTQSDCFAHK